MRTIKTDILIVGGGVGGCAAALAATAAGRSVVLTETTDWLGGQFTAQLVPPDEHNWIEHHGRTERYQSYRQAVRDYYRRHYPLTALSARDPYLNPGGRGVSTLGHEPRVARAVLDQMLSSALCRGLLTILLEHDPIAVDVERDAVRSVTLMDRQTQEPVVVEASYVLDATELGDLLPMSGCEFVTGAEGQRRHGEPHAGAQDAGNVQAFTWCMALAHDPRPGADHRIARPADYDTWKQYRPALSPGWTGPLLDWTHCHHRTLGPRLRTMFDDEAVALTGNPYDAHWPARRLRQASHFTGHPIEEISVMNWPVNDYWLGDVIGADEPTRQRHYRRSRELTLCVLYWLQHEASRPDGGVGYPSLRPAPEISGTPDGLAKSPYIRESRRIQACFTITEHHVGEEARQGRPAEWFDDSVGTGYYRIDLHPSTGGDNFIDIGSLPFQIPLGALIPVRITNLLPACKNIGTTHITNGCYRLHPVEWNIGESVGTLAAYCLEHHASPRQVLEQPRHLRDLQAGLRKHGVPLEWPQDHPGAAQRPSSLPTVHVNGRSSPVTLART